MKICLVLSEASGIDTGYYDSVTVIRPLTMICGTRYDAIIDLGDPYDDTLEMKHKMERWVSMHLKASLMPQGKYMKGALDAS